MPAPVIGAATVSPYNSDYEEDDGYTCNTGFTTVKASNASDEERRNKEVRTTTCHALFSSVKPSVHSPAFVL
jgi:hypothetical protein